MIQERKLMLRKLLIPAGLLFPLSVISATFAYPAITGSACRWFGFNRFEAITPGELPFLAASMLVLLFAIWLLLGGGGQNNRGLYHTRCGFHPPENEHPESGWQRPSLEDPGRCGEGRGACGS